MRFDFNQEFIHLMQSHSLDTVVILGHINPDGDACGCVMGLAHYIKDNYPQIKAIPYLADTMWKGPRKLVAEDEDFDPFLLQELPERYAAISCDTATMERMIGAELFQKAASTMAIDHHAANEGFGDVRYIRIADSCAELLYEILDPDCLKHSTSLNTVEDGKRKPTAADYIYLGILHDTDCFKRNHESTFLAAAGLRAMGVDHKYVMRTMENDTSEDVKKKAAILEEMQVLPELRVAYVYLDREAAEKKQIGYDDIHPISGELRDLEDIDIAFTMYEEAPGHWRFSFRSDERIINVNELAKEFGGGGHAGAAGLRTETDQPEQLLQEILGRIRIC